MMNGILRIQTYRPRQSAPVEGVTVVITGSDFTAHRITDAEGNAEDVAICAPACALSLDENNTTTLPYAVCSLTARKPGYRTVHIQGIQIFAGQVTLARPEMIPDTEEGKDIVDPPVIIPTHALFAGNGGSGPAPTNPCTGSRVLDRVIVPKNITVHLGRPAASARNVTVSFRDYIANVASSEVYPTWADENTPTGRQGVSGSERPFDRDLLLPSQRVFCSDNNPPHQKHRKLPGQMGNLCQLPHTLPLRRSGVRFLRLLFQFCFQATDTVFRTFYFLPKRLVHL